MADLIIRELQNGQMVPQNGDVIFADVFFDNSVAGIISNGGSAEDGEVLVCVHWVNDQFYMSAVSLSTSESYDSLNTQALIQNRQKIEKFIYDVWATCGLMLAKVTVQTLTFFFLHAAKDSFLVQGQKLLRLFREFYHGFYQCAGLPKFSLRVKPRGRNSDACKGLRHFNPVQEKSHACVGTEKLKVEDEKSVQKRFARIEKELVDQNNLMEMYFSILKNQNEQQRIILFNLLDELHEYTEIQNDTTAAFHDENAQGAHMQGGTEVSTEHDNGPPTIAENEETHGESSNGVHQQSLKQEGKSVPPVRIPKNMKFHKYESTVEEYRKAQRDAGVTKDELDPSEESGSDIREILIANLRQQERMMLKAPVNKVKIGSTTCGAQTITTLLNMDVFRSSNPENAGLWQGVGDAMLSGKETRSKSAADTVICIHTSGGMDEGAFQGVKEIVLTLLGGLEDVAAKHRIRENVGLVIPGGKKPVVHHLTKNYRGIQETLNNTNGKARSPLLKALICSLACLTRGGLCTFGLLRHLPRLILMTDGLSQNDADSAEVKRNLFSAVRAMGGDDVRRTVIDPIVWIPISSANKDLLKRLAEVSNGIYLEGNHVDELCNYQKMKRVKADVLCYMMALGEDPSESHFGEAFEACGQELRHEEKLAVARFVAEKLINIYREPGEMHNFNNINLHDGLPPLGTRVVRGPDWTSGDQDSGLPGTVVNHGHTGDTVWVVWDSNMCGQYGYSVNTGYDLLVSELPRMLNSQTMEIGVQVERGPDWHYGNEDGGPQGRGVIIRRNGELFKVRWNNGYIQNYRFCEERYEIWVKSSKER